MKIAVTKFARMNCPFSIDMDILVKKCEIADLMKSHIKFCKYISLPVKGLESSIVPITDENRHLLVSGYLTRKNNAAKELPYLSRWFEKGTVSPVPAKSVTVILYNRDQLALEKTVIRENYGIVAVQCEPNRSVSPMTPATIERNALGIEFGGNGIPIDRKYYAKAVEFWEKWAIIK